MTNDSIKTAFANEFLTAEALKICASALVLVKRIIDANSILDENGAVRYYFNGSLSLNLLAICDECVDESGVVHPLSAEVRKWAAAAVRRMHDIDLMLPLGCTPELVMPPIENAQATIGDAFDADFPFEYICFDLWPAREVEKLVCLKVDGYQIWINDPVEMLTHKLVFALRSFEWTDSAKLIRDFDRLYRIASTYVSREVLLGGAQRALDLHPAHTLNWFRSHDQNPAWTGEVVGFLQELMDRHPERKYLDRLTYGSRHSIALMRLFGKLRSDDDKDALLLFLNEHQALVQENYSSLLDVLDTIDVERLEDELACLRYLISKETAMQGLFQLLVGLTGESRQQYLLRLQSAAETMSPLQLHCFFANEKRDDWLEMTKTRYD